MSDVASRAAGRVGSVDHHDRRAPSRGVGGHHRRCARPSAGDPDRRLRLDPVPVDEAVAAEWARLRVLLRDGGRRMPVNDSWIAATALALGVPVITHDGDFPDLPDLAVVRV